MRASRHRPLAAALLLVVVGLTSCRSGCGQPSTRAPATPPTPTTKRAAAAPPPAEAPAPPAPACDDGDPCTVDLFHPARGGCIHVPDRFCDKACSGDEDCSLEGDGAPCSVGRCVAGQCRFTAIGKDECVRCDDSTPCQGSFCDPRACRDGYCRHAPRSCDDGDPHTWDRCDDDAGRCEHLLADGRRPCAADGDCATDHPCQRFACRDGTCHLTEATAACSTPLDLPRPCDAGRGNRDCIQAGETCVAGPCRGGFCVWREVPNSVDCKFCEGDHDCPGSFCRWPMCTGTVCTQEEVPFCADRDPHTKDFCADEIPACLHEHTRTPPKCKAPPRDDGDPTTVDACDPSTGSTRHLPKGPGPRGDGPCSTSDRCVHAYPGPDGFCLAEKVDCRCKDDQVCPARCDPARGCVLDQDAGEPCKTHDDCSLGSACARMVCVPGDEGFCWGTLLSDCVPCGGDGDCRVDGWCVGGTCGDDGYCDYFDLVTCDDGDPCTLDLCHGQRDDPCTHDPIPGCRRE